MTRTERLIVIRAAVLGLGLMGGGAFLVAPLWSRAEQAAEERRGLAADQSRLASEWNDFAARMVEKGVTGPLNSVALPDSLLSRLLLDRPLPPSPGLLRASTAIPAFLGRLARIGTAHDIDWSGAKSLGGELTTVVLSDGEALPVRMMRFELTGRGSFAAIGRALREINDGEVPVRVQTVQLKAAPDDLVDATLTLEIFGAP